MDPGVHGLYQMTAKRLVWTVDNWLESGNEIALRWAVGRSGPLCSTYRQQPRGWDVDRLMTWYICFNR